MNNAHPIEIDDRLSYQMSKVTDIIKLYGPDSGQAKQAWSHYDKAREIIERSQRIDAAQCAIINEVRDGQQRRRVALESANHADKIRRT